MSFALAQQVADAALYQGYILYPYRASSVKNQGRWQFGVVAPRRYTEAGHDDEACAMQTECLVDTQGAAEVDVRVRFLQLQTRRVEAADAARDEGFRAAGEFLVDGQAIRAWDEAVERTLDIPGVVLADLPAGGRSWPVTVGGGLETEVVRNEAGQITGRIRRERQPIDGHVWIESERIASVVKLRVRIDNESAWPGAAEAGRPEALHRALLGAHTLLAVRHGVFVSLLEPPRWAEGLAATCRQIGTWPVLVGEPGQPEVLLSAPIILYDYPAVAAESPGDLFDATEIDEILTLRVMTLTDDERREARTIDARAREIVERSDEISAELFGRLHGAIRDLQASPDQEEAGEHAKGGDARAPTVPPDGESRA